ncbi:MAG: diguanylate cyclase [Deltaproteobacteria bacterium]|nr:diguanylate cyclase [Deltaproteobacteria bacterium]MBN2671333.1 diguanylate cyclase [Deltaproteobacteria bacterium]
MTTADNEKTAITSFEAIRKQAGEEALVQIYPPGTDLGKKWVLNKPQISIGRGANNDIVIETQAVSRRHSILELNDKQRILRDMNSTNGTYINGEKISSRQLQPGDQVKIGDRVFKYLVGSDIESVYHEEIYRMTIVDGLTGIYNKRFFLDELSREAERARRYERPLSLIMFDIDHFKQINDTYGHVAGDAVLQTLSKLVQANIRQSEIFARYGGEEFAILIPEITINGASSLAEKIRNLISEHHFQFENQRIPVTVSLGVDVLNHDNPSPKALIKRADQKLYQAKKAGRNRVVG